MKSVMVLGGFFINGALRHSKKKTGIFLDTISNRWAPDNTATVRVGTLLTARCGRHHRRTQNNSLSLPITDDHCLYCHLVHLHHLFLRFGYMFGDLFIRY